MLDDTPQVKWSNAWWGMVFLGFLVPAFLIGLLVFCLFADKAFAIGLSRYRKIEIHEVFEFQATLMMVCYGSLASASFAYGYARHHPTLGFYYDKILGVSLAVAAVCVVWGSILFLF